MSLTIQDRIKALRADKLVQSLKQIGAREVISDDTFKVTKRKVTVTRKGLTASNDALEALVVVRSLAGGDNVATAARFNLDADTALLRQAQAAADMQAEMQSQGLDLTPDNVALVVDALCQAVVAERKALKVIDIVGTLDKVCKVDAQRLLDAMPASAQRLVDKAAADKAAAAKKAEKEAAKAKTFQALNTAIPAKVKAMSMAFMAAGNAYAANH